MHQIKTTKQAGYEEREIVSAVIGSVIPSLILRNILEMLPSTSCCNILKHILVNKTSLISLIV